MTPGENVLLIVGGPITVADAAALLAANVVAGSVWLLYSSCTELVRIVPDGVSALTIVSK